MACSSIVWYRRALCRAMAAVLAKAIRSSFSTSSKCSGLSVLPTESRPMISSPNSRATSSTLFSPHSFISATSSGSAWASLPLATWYSTISRFSKARRKLGSLASE